MTKDERIAKALEDLRNALMGRDDEPAPPKELAPLPKPVKVYRRKSLRRIT